LHAEAIIEIQKNIRGPRSRLWASAQAYPARPITMIVPFGAGSINDVVGRGVERLEQAIRDAVPEWSLAEVVTVSVKRCKIGFAASQSLSFSLTAPVHRFLLLFSHVLRVAFGILEAENGKKTLTAATIACMCRRPHSRWHRFQSP
jgi:hypothetical protein